MPTRFLSAKAAAAQLGISLPTLYAYVSRGLIRSEESSAKKRTRRYYAEDVDRLLERKAHRSNPEKTAAAALHAGLPVLQSSLTFIDADTLYYRGIDVAELARSNSVEEVATLLWTGTLTEPPISLWGPSPFLPLRCHQVWPQIKDLTALERAHSLLPLAAASDQGAYDLQESAVGKTGARILHLLTAAIAGLAQKTLGISQTLEQAWLERQSEGLSLLGAALIVSADHELNASTFAARIAASTGANPYGVVSAGLATLSGFKHGGASTQAETLLLTLEQGADPRQVIAERLQSGQHLPGFGHLIYRDVDPRAGILFDLLEAQLPDSPALALSRQLIESAAQFTDQRHNIDLALAALSRCLALPLGSAAALFALGRTIGWIAHAIEQYRQPGLIRPRARYSGPPPPAA